ncbi:MAG: exosortase, partial [Candidatus Hydrogenedentes bacterium]|nr:exosortase [Candidatus Hydrogenedentota bacterium]
GRGLKLVKENFGVLSPVSVPKFHQSAWAKSILVEQVKDAARWMGIENPLVWVACPPAAEVIDRIPAAGLIYQRTDRFEHFPGVNAERIRAYDLTLKNKADLTLFCSSSVYNDELSDCNKASFVDHGVDYETFAAAGDAADDPADVRAIPRPRIGFVGGIDAHTFDPELFVGVATEMADCSFVMVGGCSLPEDWCVLDNVHLLGRKPYEQVASYMAACDVLIMPWNRSPWIKACNPVKLKEYLAVGRPVVTTSFDELSHYDGFVAVAEDAPGFVREIRTALDSPPNVAVLRERVAQETWAAKATAVLEHLQETGVQFLHALPPLEKGSEDSVDVDKHEPVKSRENSHGVVKSYWKKSTIFAAGLLAMIGIWATSDAWQDIFRLAARDEESSHIFLAIPAALWLVWVRKEHVADARRSGTLLGACMVALGWLLFAVGDVQLYQSMWHFGAILIVVGCAVSVLGREVLVRLWPAFAVLIFLVPVPGIIRAQIAPPMQTVTAQMTAFVLQTMGEPITLSGKVLVVNGVSVGIAEACNGIRMVFALALVCFFYAFSTELRTGTRLFILLASPLIAIVVNIVRLVPTVWLYGHAEIETAEQFHDIVGWAMMPVALLGLAGVNTLLAWAFSEDPVRLDYPEAPELESPTHSSV